MASTSVALTWGKQRATRAMPPLPGAHSSASTRGERDKARQTACSRPPPPMTRTFMGFNLLFNLWLRQRKGGRSSVRPPGEISA